MKNKPANTLHEEAAQWTVRRDRGLSAAESIEYELWLAEDERHGPAMDSMTQTWSLLDRIPASLAQSILEKNRRQNAFRRRIFVTASLAVAACLVLLAFTGRPFRSGHDHADGGHPAKLANVDATAGPRALTLTDGTVVELNTGGSLREAFTTGVRHVFLTRGEAHFSVTKDPTRPFIVHAGRIEVRAVGTAFNVNWQSGAIEVLVTEGVVKLSAEPPTTDMATVKPEPQALRLVNSGHRAIIALEADAPASTSSVVVVKVSAEEISHSLAWNQAFLRLQGASLAEVITAMTARTGRRIVLADPALGQLRLGGRLRTDDIEGFTSLLATSLDLEIEHAADGSLILHKK